MRYWSVLALGLALAFDASAGSQHGRVTQIHTRASDGLILFFLEGTPSSRPACASVHTYWMIKDENSDVGKRQLAMLMAAKAAGTPVSVGGAGACTRWHDGEDVNHITY